MKKIKLIIKNILTKTFVISVLLFYSFNVFAITNKVVALSFDDGPNPIYTTSILKTLQENNAKATFFVVGSNAKQYPNLLKEELANGNDIGNHTYTHPNLSKASNATIEKEITKTNEAIYEAVHVYPVLFRPPFGTSSADVNQIINKLGMRKVTWDYMVNDYDANKTTTEKIASQVIANVHPGAIITMHDGYTNREKTAAALPIIISALKKQGYTFVTVSEILHTNPYQKNP